MKRFGEDVSDPSKKFNWNGGITSVPPPPVPPPSSYYQQNPVPNYYNGMHMTTQEHCYTQYSTMQYGNMEPNPYAIYNSPQWNYPQSTSTPMIYDTSQPPPTARPPPSTSMPALSRPPPAQSSKMLHSPHSQHSAHYSKMQPPLSQNPLSPNIGPSAGRGRGGQQRGGYRAGLDRRGGKKNNYVPNPVTQCAISIKSPAKVNALPASKMAEINTLPTTTATSIPSATTSASGDSDDNNKQPHSIMVNKKAKRKPMSVRYVSKVMWQREHALEALELERQYNKLQRTAMLILKFPDPDLNKEIVKKYSPFIESVHFQQPSTSRYCFVQLKEGADIEKVRDELCKIPFGTGKIVAEKKNHNVEDVRNIEPEEVDPYTLYIGNLPTTITVKEVKAHFPKAVRVDVGYAQRMKYTRYAFIRYASFEAAKEAYATTFNMLIDSRSLIVRFRRAKSSIGLPGEVKIPNPPKVHKPPSPTNVSKSESDKPSDSSDTPISNHELTDQEVTDHDVTDHDVTDLEEDIQTLSSEVDEATDNGNDGGSEGSGDVKTNVLTDAQKLLAKEVTDDFGGIDDGTLDVAEVKSENRDDDQDDPNLANPDDPSKMPVEILGSCVKEEFDDDDLLDQLDMFGDAEEDELDFEPEEDDIVTHETSYVPSFTYLQNKHRNQDDDLDEKPNIETLVPPISSLPNNKRPSCSILPAPISPDLPLDSCTSSKSKRPRIDSEDNDELDALFESMNPPDSDSDGF